MFVYDPAVHKKGYDLPIHERDLMVSGFSYKYIIDTFIASTKEEERTEENLWKHIKGCFQELRNELEENWELCKDGMMEQIVPKEKDRIRHNGKTVYNVDTFNFADVKIGDYVDEGVADYFISVVPPRTMKTDLVQLGEEYDNWFDPKINGTRPVYATIVKVAKGIWQFRGYCFRGDYEENGKPIRDIA